MAEIHDQFDTVLILDFGSQVSINRATKCDVTEKKTTVQPSDNSKMSRTPRLRRAYALHDSTKRYPI